MPGLLPVCPLCAPLGSEWHPYPWRGGAGACGGRVPAAAALLLPAPMRSDPAPNAARLAPAVAENVGGRKKRRIKAGVASGAPGQSHRPAVRVGATGCGNFGVAQKWGQNREGDITFAVNIPEALLSQGKNRGQSGNLPGFCSDAGLLIPPIPPQKLRRNETKKRRFRNAAN